MIDIVKARDCKILHALPVYEGMKPKPLRATLALVKAAARAPYRYTEMVIGPRTPIRLARNGAVEASLAIKATHLLLQDDDVLPTQEALDLLLEQDRSVIGGVIQTADGRPCVWKGTRDSLEPWHGHPPGVFQATAVGSGFMLINVDVFRSMPAPWFYYQNDDRTMDVNFCLDAQDVGFQVWCHGGVRIPQLLHDNDAI